jgi:hypothetical protein
MNTTVHTGCRYDTYLCLMFVPRSFFHYIYLAHALNPLLFSFRMLFLSFQIENMQQRQHILVNGTKNTVTSTLSIIISTTD